jgi:hypothetical protein
VNIGKDVKGASNRGQWFKIRSTLITRRDRRRRKSKVINDKNITKSLFLSLMILFGVPADTFTAAAMSKLQETEYIPVSFFLLLVTSIVLVAIPPHHIRSAV